MKVFAIALNTSREAIRNRILYSILLFACLLTGIAAAFGSASIGDTMKFVKDFSFFSISLFGVIATVVLGVNLLSKELEKRTIYNILSKPVARWQFLVGKFLGMLATLALMMTVMGGALFGLLGLLEGRAEWAVLPVVGTMILELGILLAVAMFFSSIVVTPGLAGVFTAATFVAGRSVGMLDYFLDPGQPAALRYVMRALYTMLPHLDRLYVADRVVSGDAPAAAYYGYVCVYAAAYAAILLALSVGIFRRREFL